MPELPEVETIRRNLNNGYDGYPSVLGQTVESVNLIWSGALATPDPDFFNGSLPGQSIQAVNRRAKFLDIVLAQAHLVVHLRMSGDLRLVATDDPSLPLPHDRLVLHFTSGYSLAFNDARKFGRVWLLPHTEALFAPLGPEPFDPGLTPESFYTMLHARQRAIKPLLMDQHFLAGMGNIYTDEALFSAGIHPQRRSDSLTPVEAETLLATIRETLLTGIAHNGSSIDWVYKGGAFQNYFQVYQQTNNPCPRCGQPIERLVVGQRGTHICPHCQPFNP